jgi:hypothetical protein
LGYFTPVCQENHNHYLQKDSKARQLMRGIEPYDQDSAFTRARFSEAEWRLVCSGKPVSETIIDDRRQR